MEIYFNNIKLEKKFVIHNGVLIMGQVEFHKDLVKNMDKTKVIGGGKWHCDNENNTIYFYGESNQFGQVTKEEFDNAFKHSSVLKRKLVFTNDYNLKNII